MSDFIPLSNADDREFCEEDFNRFWDYFYSNDNNRKQTVRPFM